MPWYDWLLIAALVLPLPATFFICWWADLLHTDEWYQYQHRRIRKLRERQEIESFLNT